MQYTYDGLYIVTRETVDPGSYDHPASVESEIESVEIDCPEEWADTCEEWGWDLADPLGYAERFRDCWEG